MARGEVITTVTVPAASYDLVDLLTVKDDLDITDTTKDSALKRYISSASIAAQQFCNRTFQQEFVLDEFWPKRDRFPEIIRGGLRPLQLSRFPLTSTRCLAGIAAPAAPTLSSVAGGALSATTYYVRATYLTALGETVASTESLLAVAANNLLQVASPAAVATATGWNVYIATAANKETLQNASPLAMGSPFTEPTSGLLSGAAALPDFVSVIENDIALIEGIDFRVDFALGQLTRLVTGLDGQTVYPRAWLPMPISVSYGAGYKTIPLDIQDAILRMVKARYYARKRDPALRAENIFDVREATYWITSGSDAGNLTPDVEDLLNNYRVPVIVS